MQQIKNTSFSNWPAKDDHRTDCSTKQTSSHIILHIEGFRPEWYISAIYHCRDTPFWSVALDMQLSPHQDQSLTGIKGDRYTETDTKTDRETETDRKTEKDRQIERFTRTVVATQSYLLVHKCIQYNDNRCK